MYVQFSSRNERDSEGRLFQESWQDGASIGPAKLYNLASTTCAKTFVTLRATGNSKCSSGRCFSDWHYFTAIWCRTADTRLISRTSIYFSTSPIPRPASFNIWELDRGWCT